MGTFDQIDSVFKEYPQLKNSIIEISKNNNGGMATNFSGKLTFNPNLYNDVTKVNEWYSNCVKNGFFPKNTTWINAGVHELGHRLEAEIIKSQHNTKSAMITDWNNGDTAKIIVRNSLTDIKKEYKLKDISNQELLSTISGYAATDPGEAIAEAFSDYWINREGASILSQKIMDTIKGLLK